MRALALTACVTAAIAVARPTPARAAGDEAAPAPTSTPDTAAPEGDAAAGDEGDDADDQSATNATRVSCLDDVSPDGNPRKGVQRRPFLKDKRFELAAVGGLYASDVLSSTYTFGGALSFFPSEDFGVEGLVTYAPVDFRLEEPFTAFDREQRFTPGSALQAIGSLLFVPFHAKLKFTEESILAADLMIVGGAGRTFHDSVQGLTWEGGVGLKVYLGQRVSFRLDIRDFILPQEVLGRGRITNNVSVLAGLGVWFL